MSESQRDSAVLGSQPRVILAAPDDAWAEEFAPALNQAGFIPHRCPSPEATAMAVSYRDPSAVLIDASFLDRGGPRFLDALRAAVPGVPLVVVTSADDGEERRVTALSRGADDCLTHPFASPEALIRIRRLIERRRTEKSLRDAKSEARQIADRLRRDLAGLRVQLTRNVTLLQRAVDFHQRLEPTGDPAAFQEQMLRHLSMQLGIDRLAYLAAPHPGSSWLNTRATWGMPVRMADRVRIHSTGELASCLEATGRALTVPRLNAISGLRLELGILAAGGFAAAVPLLQTGKLLGVVLLGETESTGVPDEETLQLAQFLTSALVPAITAQQAWNRERHVSADTLGALVNQLENGNPYLRGHSARVAGIADDLGARLGLSALERTRLNSAALLHDVGRFESDAALWSKTGPLTGEDWQTIRRHPQEGARLLAEAAWPEAVQEAVRHHHEKWDGSGYPNGLAGTRIPLLARVLAVADALEALTSARPHREAVDHDEAVLTIRGGAGVQFDPEVAALLVAAGEREASA